MSPSECQERIGMLKECIEALEAEERQLAQEAPYEPSKAISAAEAAQWASACQIYCRRARRRKERL